MVCTRGWGNKIKDKIQKDQNPISATYEELEINQECLKQKQDTAHTPCTQHHQRGGQTTEVTSGCDPWTHLYPPHIKTVRPSLAEQPKETYLFLLPSAAAGTPIKACLNFLSGPWLIPID